MSSVYETCSADLARCPDQRCDELEITVATLCPQDCISTLYHRHHNYHHHDNVAINTLQKLNSLVIALTISALELIAVASPKFCSRGYGRVAHGF